MMKTSVLDFIDSNTLRQHLSGQVLEPAIECILIAQCYNRAFEDKLEALQERYDTYSTEEFKKGVYNSWAEDFKSTLKAYISLKRDTLSEAYKANNDDVYVIDSDDSKIDKSIWKTLEAAIDIARRMLDDDEGCTIIKRKTDDSSYKRIQIFLNTNKDIYDISSLSYSDKEFEIEYGIQHAYAELPHLYENGDILRCCDNYSVIADVIRHETLPPYMVHSDYTDMCLYCLGYYNDKVHSCGGSFGHEHIPLLKAEICSEDELPEGQKILLALSRLFKGKIRIVDFLESYSNRDMEYLLK